MLHKRRSPHEAGNIESACLGGRAHSTKPNLTGNRCQCARCGKYFNGVAGFDEHRVGSYGIDRRCLAVAQMAGRGWFRNLKGFWVTDSREQRRVRQSAAGAGAPRGPWARVTHRPPVHAPELHVPAGAA